MSVKYSNLVFMVTPASLIGGTFFRIMGNVVLHWELSYKSLLVASTEAYIFT